MSLGTFLKLLFLKRIRSKNNKVEIHETKDKEIVPTFDEGKVIIADCGHETIQKDTIVAFGESGVMTLPVKDGKTEYCHRCLEKMAIRCAWCGKAIFIGSPITLYSSAKDNFKIPEYAVVYNKEPLQLVGCLRWDCAETGGDRAGFWYPPGKVRRVLSPIEIAMKTGGTVAVSDLTDAKEAIDAMKKIQK